MILIGKWRDDVTENMNKQITFRVHEKEYEKIAQLARVNKVSIAEQARRLCRGNLSAQRTAT